MEIPLTPRSVEVLHAIVQSYVETGEPVASRTIARRRKDGLSSATIRNIMADLADMGYLDQPHTSAGRVPTAKAFRDYARSLAASRLLANELGRLHEEFENTRTMEQRAELGSHLLMQLTRNVGIVAAIPTSSLQLDRIELLLLPDMRVLMVVVTKDGNVSNQLARLEEPVTQDELHSIRNYVNQHFAGWMLASIRRELNRRLELESSAYNNLLRKLTVLNEKGLLNVGLTPAVFMEGASYLVGLDLKVAADKWLRKQDEPGK